MNKLCYCTRELISKTATSGEHVCGICNKEISYLYSDDGDTMFQCDQDPEDCIYNDNHFGNYTVCSDCYAAESDGKVNLDLSNKNKFILNKFCSTIPAIS